MKKFKKVVAMGLAAMMALSAMCVGVSAANDNFVAETVQTQSVNNENAVEIEPFSLGDGEIMPLGYIFKNTRLENTEGRFTFTITSDKKYFKVWVGNESAATSNPVSYKIELYKFENGDFTYMDEFNAGPGYMYNGNFFDYSNFETYNNTSVYGAGQYMVVISNVSNYPLTGAISVRRENTPLS